MWETIVEEAVSGPEFTTVPENCILSPAIHGWVWPWFSVRVISPDHDRSVFAGMVSPSMSAIPFPVAVFPVNVWPVDPGPSLSSHPSPMSK